MTETKMDMRFNKTAPTFEANFYAGGNTTHVELIVSSDKEKLTLLLEFDDYEKLKELLGVKAS